MNKAFFSFPLCLDRDCGSISNLFYHYTFLYCHGPSPKIPHRRTEKEGSSREFAEKLLPEEECPRRVYSVPFTVFYRERLILRRYFNRDIISPSKVTTPNPPANLPS